MGDYGSLLLASGGAVTTVGCVAAAGAYACHRGVLTPPALKVIDKLVSELLTPAMIFHKVIIQPAAHFRTWHSSTLVAGRAQFNPTNTCHGVAHGIHLCSCRRDWARYWAFIFQNTLDQSS